MTKITDLFGKVERISSRVDSTLVSYDDLKALLDDPDKRDDVKFYDLRDRDGMKSKYGKTVEILSTREVEAQGNTRWVLETEEFGEVWANSRPTEDCVVVVKIPKGAYTPIWDNDAEAWNETHCHITTNPRLKVFGYRKISRKMDLEIQKSLGIVGGAKVDL